MKKIHSFLFASLLAVSANAQLTTSSNYDLNNDGKVNNDDAKEIVSKYVGNKTDNTQVVDYATLLSTLKSIDGMLDKISEVEQRLNLLEPKVGTAPEVGSHNGHEYVNLGTGVLWATTNVGAESPTDFGDYFAWGATEPQSVYDWVHCPYQTQDVTDEKKSRFTKYLGLNATSYKDSSAADKDAIKITLDPEDDAAHVKWGGNWRMPTKEDFQRLKDECFWKWVPSYKGKNVVGYMIFKTKLDEDKGKVMYKDRHLSNGALYTESDLHIFFPCAGYHTDQTTAFIGQFGEYWSSSVELGSPNYGVQVNFRTDGAYIYSYARKEGCPVRPICQ